MDTLGMPSTEFSHSFVREHYLSWLSEKLQKLFPNSIGLYLYGSLSMNDFSHISSDIDLVLLLKDPLLPPNERFIQGSLQRFILAAGSLGTLLDLSLIPTRALSAPQTNLCSGFRLESGQIRKVSRYPLNHLETMSVHLHGQTVFGIEFLQLFPVPSPYAHVDDFFAFLENIFKSDHKFSPFQPFLSDKAPVRSVTRFLTQMALFMFLLENGTLISPSEALQSASFVPVCESNDLWRNALDIRRGGKSPDLKDFPGAYVSFLRRILELAGIGNSRVGSDAPTPDSNGFIHYEKMHCTFQRKLSLDYLFQQWVPGRGLRPKAPIPSKISLRG